MTSLVLVVLAQLVRARCPVDEHAFRAREAGQVLGWGGVDYDTCVHAQSPELPARKVWTCPACYFTGEPEEFLQDGARNPRRPIGEREREGLRAARTPLSPIERNTSQDRIPGWVRFDLWAQSLGQRGVHRGWVGKALLSAAWEIRREGAPVLEGIDEFGALWVRYGVGATFLDLRRQEVANRTDYDLEKARAIEADVQRGELSGLEAPLGLYLAAYLYRRHGENVEALRVAAALESAAAQNTFLARAIEGVAASIEREREFQRRALEELAAAADDRSTRPRDKGDIEYLAGETCRRLGDAAGARTRFERVIANRGAALGTQNWARCQRDKLPPE